MKHSFNQRKKERNKQTKRKKEKKKILKERKKERKKEWMNEILKERRLFHLCVIRMFMFNMFHNHLDVFEIFCACEKKERKKERRYAVFYALMPSFIRISLFIILNALVVQR